MSKHDLSDSLDEQNVDDAEIGDDDEPTPQVLQAKPGSRKREQYATFNSWFSQQAKQISQNIIGQTMKTEDEEALSLRTIMARQESERIIASPRDYQMELFEKAKQENSIAVLDTGSGKTLIAVLLLRHTIDQELEDRAAGRHKRISFFLVDKVALVFQQHAVLKANLSQEIERVCGDMGAGLWTGDVWKQHFEKNMVIVATADVLLQCLSHSFINIEQINLLVFDEAHHAKKGHTYARIIKEHYLHASPHLRPRIFGMTASPVDVGGDDVVDLQEKAKELEIMLSSKIVTIADSPVLGNAVHRPKPTLFKYNNYHSPFLTPLYQSLWARFHDMNSFRKLFEHAKESSNELGSWCSDAYWSFAFDDAVSKKMEMRIQQQGLRANQPRSAANVDKDIIQLREASEVVRLHELGIPSIDPTTLSLSSKVLKLYQILKLTFAEASKSRCLVFVEKRYTAKLLMMVFTQIGGEHLKPGILVGTRNTSVSGMQYSLKEQVVTLMKFRKGDLNCLFATSVAEEGLDIQDCNIVIRFDLAKTMIQYVQSRGRGRHAASKFYHLVDGSLEQQERLYTLSQAEGAMRKFCQSLPADRRLAPDAIEHDYNLMKECSTRVYVEKSTGAKLTYDFALIVLAHFVSCLPSEEGDVLSAHYYVTSKAGKFTCEVTLPAQSPIHSAVGRESPRKAIARRSAAFEACLLLRKGKYLDANLLPIYAKQAPIMRNALLAINSKANNSYYMQTKPSVWSEARGTVPATLYLNSIDLSGDWDRPVRGLALLTRQRLPSLPQFPIYRGDGAPVQIMFKSSTEPVSVSAAQLKQLTSFCLRVYKDIFNKTFEHNEAAMSYWIAPLQDEAVMTRPARIDWGAVGMISSNESEKWNPGMPVANLINKFLVDPFDGGRRFFTIALAHHLKATDPTPPNVAPGGLTDSILSYSVKLWKASKRKRTWIEDQPVLEAEKVQHRLNILSEPTEAEKEAITHCYVCPEPMEISQLPTDVAAMCLLFPAVLHRIESYLIAIEHCEEVDLNISVPLALEAITKDSANSDDVNAEKINFQHGMGANYERLELIGDCFLKMATSISVFVLHLNIDEFQMHVSRMLMLCNKNLFNHATKYGWFKYIRSQSFSR